MLSTLLSELSDPLDRFVPIGAILLGPPGREGFVVLSGELSGLEAVVLVFVWVLSEEKRLKVADRGDGDSALTIPGLVDVAGVLSPRERCSRTRRSCSLCSRAT